MENSLSRRHWLKASALLSAGVAVGIRDVAAASHINGILPTGEYIPNLNSETSAINEMRIRLNANENPHGPSPLAKKALSDAIDTSFRYPFAETRQLKSILAEKVGLTPEHVLLGGGSTEILTLAGLAFGLDNGSIVSAHPSFETVMRTASRFDSEWIRVPLDSDYKLDLDKMAGAIKTNTRMVYVCNPNNPTGTIQDPQALKDFCSKISATQPLFVDEAYNDFLDEPDSHTTLSLLKEGKDLIVARTFSKIHGFAGLRVGWAYALPERVKQLEKYQTSLSTITMTSVMAAMASLKDKEFLAKCKKLNAEARELTYRVIEKAGYSPVKSNTSFVIFPISMNGEKFLTKMREQSVAVRAWNFGNQDYCRVSIGTTDEMKAFGEALIKVS